MELRGGRGVQRRQSRLVPEQFLCVTLDCLNIRGNFICRASCETYSGFVCIISLSVIYCVLILNKIAYLLVSCPLVAPFSHGAVKLTILNPNGVFSVAT